ncbi:MAG: hypothetical protein WCK03_02785 [Candidatus Taylorbacteria bacterium]
MARKASNNGSVEMPKNPLQKLDEAKVRRALDTGVVRGNKIFMFFRNRKFEKFNVESSAELSVAFSTAMQLVRKGCVPL